MSRIISNNTRRISQMARFSTLTISFMVALSGCLMVSGQFLQPQSHLGRLVQSITSPLVLNSVGDSDSAEGNPYNGDPSSYYMAGAGSNQEAGSEQVHRQRGASIQPMNLQQAPSQQRGVPQKYHGRGYQATEESQGAPSNNRHNQQEYQMGTYLGPTMEDKEINGVFNSNDDKDDDDGPASYDGPSENGSGRYKAAGSSSYGEPSQGYGMSGDPSGGSGYGPQRGPGSYDEESADEDESQPLRPVNNRGHLRARTSNSRGLNQAASQWQQQGYGSNQGSGYAPQGHQQDGGRNGGMMAAANGYAPYGPVDLNSIMMGMTGNPNAGYDVYNGDGSYPNQQQQQRGGPNQAGSMMQNGYYGNNGRPANNNDNDDNEAENDDD